MTPEQMLREFHAGADLPLPDHPTARPELGSQTGRAKILAEEVDELGDAIEAGDIVAIADACADVVYAVVGTAVTYGLPFDALLAEVHRSNMTKLIPPVVINEDGKICKGPHYQPPGIAAILASPIYPPHKCEFPVQPPEGALTAPGDCRTCGKSYQIEVRERQAAQAQRRLEDARRHHAREAWRWPLLWG